MPFAHRSIGIGESLPAPRARFHHHRGQMGPGRLAASAVRQKRRCRIDRRRAEVAVRAPGPACGVNPQRNPDGEGCLSEPRRGANGPIGRSAHEVERLGMLSSSPYRAAVDAEHSELRGRGETSVPPAIPTVRIPRFKARMDL